MLALAATGTAGQPITPGPQEVYLSVSLNGRATSLISRFREANGRLYVDPRDLAQLGLAPAVATVSAGEIPLEAIPGLRYHYDPAQQSVEIDAPDSLRSPYMLDTRGTPAAPRAQTGRGLVINYDAYGRAGENASLGVWSELRRFDGDGAFSNTGVGYLYGPVRRYIRYDTAWTHSDPATLQTVQAGDMISGSLTWSRSVRLGGLQWRRDFALRPDLVTFPLPAFSGTAAVPTAVDLYINNTRQFSGTLPGGPFVLRNVAGITGAGMTTIVTRDALGRPVSASLPIYIDSRLLSAGLSSYSVETGFLRRDYGLRSFDYDLAPAASASMRHGISDALTAEWHAEATAGVYTAGAGALVRLGTAGVVSGFLSATTGRSSGLRAGLGYQYVRPEFALDIQSSRGMRGYGDLASSQGAPLPYADDRLSFSLPVGARQTMALSYVALRYPGAESYEIGSVSYSLNAARRVTLNVSAFKDFKGSGNTGALLTVSMGLGDGATGSVYSGRQNGVSVRAATASRAPDYDGGWGWGVQAGSPDYRSGWLQYLGGHGQLTATADQVGGHNNLALDLNGSIVAMDGQVRAARQIYDGFALVSTDGVPDVPVLHQNRVIGKTDARGYLLVPDLNAWQDNPIAIDGTALAADMRIGDSQQDIVPRSRAGVLARFAVARYAAATIILHDTFGKALPVSTRLRHVESGKDTIVGYDGLGFIDDLQAVNTVRAEGPAGSCSASFAYHRRDDGILPTIGPLTCVPVPTDLP